LPETNRLVHRTNYVAKLANSRKSKLPKNIQTTFKMKLTNPNQSELNIRSTDLFENAQENLTKIVSAKSRSLNCNQPTPVTPSKITNHLS